MVGLIVFLLAFGLGCGQRELKEELQPNYRQIAEKIIAPKCVRCHSSLDNYVGVLQLIEPGDPEESEFYEEIESDEMPIQSAPLSVQEKKAIYDWIKKGAKRE